MRTKIYLLFLFNIFVFGVTFSQNKVTTPIDTFFNYAYWNGVADKLHLNAAERQEVLTGQKKRFLDEQLHPYVADSDIVWVPIASQKGYSQNGTNAGPCTNIDFESGTFAGWTRKQGFNPLIAGVGCCPNPNGDQTIVSGAGLDPFGGFPIVYPGGGNFSLRLGSTAIGGIADRIEQTFFVTAANANFTYRYAAVLNDGGHILAQQPKFTSEIVDSLNRPINCTFYQVSAGSGVTGYSTSPINASVIYKNWTNVAVDLTPNIGQNVTIRFTVMDCSPTGHYAYAYIDGSCNKFETSMADTTCPNVPIGICAPAGFSTTTWNGPGVLNDPNQCIVVTLPGTYICSTLLSAGCPGPTFTHTLSLLPNPQPSFTFNTTGPCATQYNFSQNITISSGAVASHTWEFGDGTTSSGLNPTHTFPAAGTYPVKLRAISSRGCMDSVVNFVTIFPFPNLSFSPPSNCINTIIQFTNTSTIGVGSITGYTWSGVSGPNSNLVNPTNSYASNGTYSITLTGISNMGCQSTLTRTLGIFPPPIISFSANPLCDINGTAFSPSTSTAIVSGSLAIFNWSFGDGGTSNLPNPVHTYTAPGTYTVNFTAISNHSCTATTSNTFIISPTPTVAFSTTSVNACSPNFSFTNNSAISAGPITYTWSFGGTNTTTAISPSYTFPTIGDYTVRLIGTSNMGCMDTAIQKISVYPYPIINFSVPASCENAIFTVSTTAVSGSVTSYLWDFGDPTSGANNTATVQNPTHYYSTTNIYNLNLNIISNLNCPSSYSTLVTVYPNPVAIFSYSTANNCSLPYVYNNTSSVSTIGASSLASYRWNFGGASTSTLANPGSVSFPGNGNYPVSLIVTSNHNCSDTMISTILVHPLPYVDFTVTPTCINKPVTFLTTSSISPVPSPGSAVTSYIFNYGDGFFTNIGNPAVHTYSPSGNYTLSFSGTSNMGCTSSVTKTLRIHPKPALNFTTTTDMCLGFPTQYTSTSSITSGTIFALSWNFGDGIIGANANPVHSYTASGTYPVKFYATTDNECTDTIQKNVTVHPLPTVTFTTANACLNTPMLFSPSTSTVVPGAIIKYDWNFGDGNSSLSQSPIHTYTTYATFTPTLTLTSSQGCVNTATSSLSIYPLPNIAFTPTGGCVNSAIQFTNNSNIPFGTISSYTWNFGSGFTTNAFQPVQSFTSPAIYEVTLAATSNEGCIRTATNNLSIYPYPSVSITPVNSSCVNELVSLYPNVSITGGNNPITGYTLSYGDGSPSFTTATALQYTLSHLYTAYNTYTVSLSAVSNGCSTNTTTLVRVYPKPFTNFTSGNFCQNDLTQFVNTSSIAATYSIQQHIWDFGDGATPQSTLQNASHVFSGPGTYSINLTEYTFPEPGLTCSLSAVKNITINPIPVPIYTNNSVCEGIATSFTNSSIPSSPTQTISGWSWFFYNNGQVNSALQSPSFTYSASGTYSTVLRAVNNFGCSANTLHMVDVWAKPTATFAVANNCLNAATNFTENSVISNTLSNSIAGWSWKFGDGTSPSYSTTQNPAHTYTAFGTYNPTLTVTSNKGCQSVVSSSLIVHPLPNVSFSPPGACVNSAIQFTNTSTIPLGSISSYVWDFNDGSPTATVTAPVHTYTASAIYVVTVTGTSNQGCVKAETNTLSIFPFSTVQITPLSGKCVNDQVLISPNVLISGNNNPVSGYTVSFGDGSSAFTSTAPLQYTVGHVYNAYGTYSINISTISNGCATTASVMINVHPNPFTSFVSSRYCFKDSTRFVNTSTIAAVSTIGQYQWNFDDGVAATSTVVSPNYSFFGVGLHTVSLTAFSYPEPGLTCTNTAIKSITINPKPVLLPFTTNSVCLGNATQFSNPSPTTGVSGWSWYTNNQMFSISNNPVYTYTSSGKFLASLIALNTFGCKSDTMKDTVKVYANPTASFVTNSDCLGKLSIFSNASILDPGEGTLTTYTWNTNGNPGFSNDQDTYFSYPTAGTYTVQLVQGSNVGCVGRFTRTVTVYPLPNVNFTVGTLCENTLANFTNLSSINSGSISSFLWTFNNQGTPTSTSSVVNPTYLFPGAGSFQTTLEAVSNFNCKSIPKVISVIVHGNPLANFTNTIICAGDPLSFANLSTSSDGTLASNQWDFNGDNIVDLNKFTPVYTYSTSGNYNASLIVTTQYGCSDTATKQVHVNPKAMPLISSDTKTGCPPLRVNFSNLSTIAPGSSFSTSWDFGNGSPVNTFTSGSTSYDAGSYDITLTMVSDAGCVTKFVNPGYVTVYPLPVAGFKVEPEEVDEDEPIITVSNQASRDANFIKYYINDGSSFGTPGFTHYIKNLKITKPMVVQIVKNQYGCGDTVFQVLNIKPAYVVYFPDVFTPNGDGTNDDFRPKGVGILKFNMNVYDRWGHQVFQTNDITDTWDGTSKNSGDSVKEDVYTWKAQVTDVFNKNHFLVGRVTVIR